MIYQLKKIKNILLYLKNKIIYGNSINNFFKILKNSFVFDNSSDKTLMIELYWDNPAYWFSLSLMINAMGINRNNCIAVVPYNSKVEISKKFSKLGIYNIVTVENHFHEEIIVEIMNNIENEDDILTVKLPFQFSNDIFYDELSRLQARANIDINDKNFPDLVSYVVNKIINSFILFNQINPDILITSHNIGIDYGALCHAAILKKCKVFTLYVEQNSLKFIQGTQKENQHKYGSGPTKSDLDKISVQHKKILIENGKNYIENRCSGKVNEIGAYFAYNKRKRTPISRNTLCERYGWDNKKPIVVLYSSNFLDRARSHGLKNFLNIKEFIFETISFLLKSKQVNCLIKAHPADEHYQEVKDGKLIDIKNYFESDLCQIADIEWDNIDLIQLSDGIITSHGTIGIEATHFRTPVLCANIGWYGHLDFTFVANSKEQFFNFLAEKFWQASEKKIDDYQLKVHEFSGWYYTNPNHSTLYKVPDTYEGIRNYKIMDKWILKNISEINFEIKALKQWVLSDEFSYHVWKIKNMNWFY